MAVSIRQPNAEYFTSLPGEYYTSQAIFDQEVEKVFEHQWIYVCHVSQVRDPGDYVVSRAALESMIVTRDKDGEIRAFFNVCRHRGSQVCQELTSGKAKQFVCPYHRWSYGLDGKLLGAPAMGIEFDFEEFGLQEAPCDVYFGSVYVWLGRGEPDMSLRDQITGGGMFAIDEEKLASVEPERLKLAHETRTVVKANWKIVNENNIECYHCASGHPELGVVCDLRAFYYERNEDGEVVFSGDGGFGLKPGMKTFALDGDWVSQKRLGTMAEGDSIVWADMVMWSSHPFFADYAEKMIVNPLTVDTSEVWLQWFVHPDAVEGVDYQLDRLLDMFSTVAEQDIVLAENQQRGLSSRRYVPGPNNALRETDMETMLTTYLQLMAA